MPSAEVISTGQMKHDKGALQDRGFEGFSLRKLTSHEALLGHWFQASIDVKAQGMRLEHTIGLGVPLYVSIVSQVTVPLLALLTCSFASTYLPTFRPASSIRRRESAP